MTGFDDWCASLESIIDTGRQGEPLQLDAVTRLAESARELGPELSDPQRRHIKKCIAKLSDIVREGMVQLDRDLAGLSERRVGIRGYGQLRSNHVGQRLRRRA